MSKQPVPQAPAVALTYVDHPEIGYTYVDALEKLWGDGPTVRIEFVAHRMDPASTQTSPTGTKHTTCRLVMPIAALPILHAHLGAMIQNMVAQGVLTPPGEAPKKDAS